jgi:uncharacterized protein with HEPN domain
MSANDALRLRDMLDRGERILHYTDDRAENDLVIDQQFQDAVLHCFLILGEAATQVSQATKEKHPQLPWRDMIGIRNHIVHGYTRLDLEIVWRTARNDIPNLVQELLQIIPPEQT